MSEENPAESGRDPPPQMEVGSRPSRTRCPDCRTVFFVSDDQLLAREGFVRCGRCGALFNAHLHSVEPPQAAILPMTETWKPPEATEVPAAEGDEAEPAAPEDNAPVAATETSPASDAAPQPAFRMPKRKAGWVWTATSGVLAIAFVIQTLWWFRGDIGARFDFLRGPLVRACKSLGCEVPLPADPDRLVLLSSELESDPAKSGRVTLHAVIANQAPFLQAYPHLELTLTDTEERVLARKIFRPRDYLPERANAAEGMRAGSETEIKLRLALDDLDASGYQIELFFP